MKVYKIFGYQRRMLIQISFQIKGAVAASWLAMIPADVEGPKGAYIWRDKQVVDWVNGPTPTIY